ncbi:interferon phi 4 [Chanos chanos]|uniref:Interferon phi 4 n=1 Tax=Chanos chanos TaxID=29144 RepID=A0A6J2VGF2_CHACN|nr:interferon a3-like [Chanos chanos]
MDKRLTRIYFVLLLCCQNLTLGCRWINHKFKQYNAECLDLLKEMPEKQIRFVIQALEEITQLFDKDMDSVSWDEDKIDTFLNVLGQQVSGLKSCVHRQVRKNNKLQLYFERLRNHTLQLMGDNIQGWEFVQTQVMRHLRMLESLPAVNSRVS